MRKTGKKGFTLTELIVVLVIMGIIAAIAVPLFTNYWRNAEFRKNEENARTVYLAHITVLPVNGTAFKNRSKNRQKRIRRKVMKTEP